MNFIIKFRFSYLPYKIKGVTANNNIKVQALTETIFGQEISDGFLFAFKGVLECLNNEDQYDYLNENCDHSLKSAWLQAVNQHKITLLESNVKESVYFDKLYLHLMYDKQKDLSKQPTKMQQQLDENIFVCMHDMFSLTQMTIPRPICKIETFIKSNKYLEVDGESNKDAYHSVTFQTVPTLDMTFMEYQNQIQNIMRNFSDKHRRNEMINEFVTGDFSWKITHME